jgi:hypothetical protein
MTVRDCDVNGQAGFSIYYSTAQAEGKADAMML